jgi:hypothetical protein
MASWQRNHQVLFKNLAYRHVVRGGHRRAEKSRVKLPVRHRLQKRQGVVLGQYQSNFRIQPAKSSDYPGNCRIERSGTGATDFESSRFTALKLARRGDCAVNTSKQDLTSVRNIDPDSVSSTFRRVRWNSCVPTSRSSA